MLSLKTDQLMNMEAINNFFQRTIAVTEPAKKHKAAWISWWNGLNYFSKSLDGATFDMARARRNEFNLANAKTPAELANVERVISTGMTSEELKGKPPAVVHAKREAVKQIGEKLRGEVAAAPPTYPVLRKGARGPFVTKWQALLGITADGNFGSGTEASTRKFQTAKGLVADGVVGAKTWSAALGKPAQNPPAPPAPSVISSIASAFKKPQATPANVAAANTAGANYGRRATDAKRPPEVQKQVQQQASAPAAFVSPTVSAATGTVKVATANMLGGIANLPVWAKIVGAVVGTGAIVWGAKTYQQQNR